MSDCCGRDGDTCLKKLQNSFSPTRYMRYRKTLETEMIGTLFSCFCLTGFYIRRKRRLEMSCQISQKIKVINAVIQLPNFIDKVKSNLIRFDATTYIVAP